MVSVEDAVIANIHRNGVNFEILVDPDKSLDFRRGKPVSIENMLVVNEVFKDAKKGERASEADLQKNFQTVDVFKIAEFIIKEGRIQLTTEQKRKLTEEKRTEIINIIAKQGVDPKTHIPHPPQRIENAIKEAHVNIDPFKPAQSQIKDIINKLQEIIPISFERVTLSIRIPADLAGKAGHHIRELAEINKEEWKSDGWVATITIPAGHQADIFEKINSITSGRAEIKVIKHENV